MGVPVVILADKHLLRIPSILQCPQFGYCLAVDVGTWFDDGLRGSPDAIGGRARCGD